MKVANVHIGHVSGDTNGPIHASAILGKIMEMSVDVAIACEPFHLPLVGFCENWRRLQNETNRH